MVDMFGACMVYCGSPKKRRLETCKCCMRRKVMGETRQKRKAGGACCMRMKEAGGAY